MGTVEKSRKSVRQKSSTDIFSNKVSSVLDDVTLNKEEKLQELCNLYHNEAVRYRENAKETLKKANINERGFYQDGKYVKTSCGIAYNGLLIAIDCYLILKGVNVNETKKRTIDFYRAKMTKKSKLCDDLNAAYEILHLMGYYDGITDSVVVKRGFKLLDMFIELINPNKN